MTDEQVSSLNPVAPAPMSWYTRDKIAPENERRLRELRKRLQLYQQISWLQRRQLERRYAKLWRLLSAARFNDQLAEYKAADLEADQLYDAGVTLKNRLKLKHEAKQAITAEERSELIDLHDTWRKMCAHRDALGRRMRSYEPLYNEFQEIKLKLDGDAAERERQSNHKLFQKEAKITGRLIRLRWALLRGCHYQKPLKNGGFKAIAPHFAFVRSDPYAHWFKIETSKRTITGDYIPQLPRNVPLPNLLESWVMEDLSSIIGQRVKWYKSVFSEEYYYKVNRLEQPGGLPELVMFQQVLDFYPEQKHAFCPFPVGVVENGFVEWGNFDDYPHILVAGTTGAGKSNFLKVLLCTLLLTQTPDEARLYLFDLKGGSDMRPYRDVPHVIAPIVKYVEDILPALRKLIIMLKQRQKLFEERGFENIYDHNQRVVPENRLPRLIVAIDELQGLVGLGATTRKIHNAIAMLLAQGRAFGIHCVLCTQYPNRRVIPGEIKGNAKLRMAFQMPDIPASLLVIGNKSAYELPRKVKGRAVCAVGADHFEVQYPKITEEQKLLAVRRASKYGASRLPFPEFERIRLPDDTGDKEPLLGSAEELAPGSSREEPEIIPDKSEYTKEEFIRLALDHLDGKLSPNAAHNFLIGAGLPSPGIRTLKRLHDEIVQPGWVEYEGVRYEFGKTTGKATTLKTASKPEEAVSIEVAHT